MAGSVPTVRLVVLNFNGGEDVVRCVGALFDLDWPADRLEVVVVDNASTDGSADAVAAAHPAAGLVRLPANRGFPANNVAFAAIEGVDYVGLVNSDAFVEPGFLGPLVATLSGDRSLGAACPKILFTDRFVPVDVAAVVGGRLSSVLADGVEVAARVLAGDGWVRPDDLADGRPVATSSPARLLVPAADGASISIAIDDRPVAAEVLGPAVDVINNVGNEVTATWFGVDRGFGQVDDGRFDEPAEVFGWCGAAVLFPSSYLLDVGGFDERLFLYYEDLDLSWRGRGRGWRYMTVPTSVVRHRLGATSGIGSALFRYHVERNRLVVLAKHAPARAAWAAAGRHLLATASYARRDVLRPVLAGRRPQPTLTWLRVRSFAGFVRLLPHALRWRRALRRTCP